MAILHRVLSSKPYQSIRASLTDLAELGEASPAPDELVLQPGWLLHELEFVTNRAVFLENSFDQNLFAAPFAYQEQITHARRVAFLDFDGFLALSQRLHLPHKLIHLFNIGHCGSTLLHQIFNASGAAQCVSEPKFSFDLPVHRDGITLERLRALTAACMRFLTLVPGYDLTRPLVLKHFSQASRIMDTFAAVTPVAINLFMYRDAVSWANSRYGFTQRRGLVADVTPENWHQRWHTMSVGAPETFLHGLVDMHAPNLRFEDFAAVVWAMYMQDFAKARAVGVKLRPFRYNDLIENREAQLNAIFADCALPAEHVSTALAGFEKDSHAGTSSARSQPARRLPSDAAEHIAGVLSNPKLALDPNLIL